MEHFRQNIKNSEKVLLPVESINVDARIAIEKTSKSIAKRKNSHSGVNMKHCIKNLQNAPWPEILPYCSSFARNSKLQCTKNC